jgi:FAD/FMN-containing dehydrogenase
MSLAIFFVVLNKDDTPQSISRAPSSTVVDFNSCKSSIRNFIYAKSSKGITDQVARIKRYYPQGIVVPRTEEEIEHAIKFAKDNNIKFSIKSGGFSQGGQWALEDGLILDMSKYKGVSFKKESESVEVKVGSTWGDIQKKIHPHGYANTVQQSSNIFPVGGSLGMNIHGRDIEYGSIVNVTNWIRVLLPNGKIVKATKDNEYAHIFKSVIGGLGLRGTILEASIKVRPNKVYETVALSNLNSNEIGNIFKTMSSNPKELKKYVDKNDLEKLSFNWDELDRSKIGLGYGRAQKLDPRDDDYLDDALIYMFVEVPNGKVKETAKIELKDKKAATESLMPMIMEMQRWSHGAKKLREKIEKKFMRTTGSQASLNYLMNPPVDFLLFKQKEESGKFSVKVINKVKKMFRAMFSVPVDSTDVLKEYFIPAKNAAQFKDSLKNVIKEYDLNNLNITYRYVPKTPEENAPLINYAKDDMVAFVVNFNVGTDKVSRANLDKWSERLVEEALDAGGVHYLAYEPNATLDQLLRAYPGMKVIFDEMINDPNPVFMNEYIKKYFNEYKESVLKKR